jgi:uncharacterized protein
MSRVVYFEIPVDNLDRAASFYESVFECTLERGSVDGNAMAFFPGGVDAVGVAGALVQGESYRPSLNGARIYFGTQDILAVLARVSQAGGRMLYPATSIGDLGSVAEFEDSEGNCIALHAR